MRSALATILVLAFALPALPAETQKAGAALEGLAPTDLGKVLEKPEDGKKVRLEGTVKAVCQNKGCWLELTQGEKSVHVTFKDYGFFVPKDCAGKKVVIEGVVKVAAPDPDTVKHLQGEGAGAAAGSSVSVVATGVEISPK